MENLETRLVPFMGADLMAARDGDGQVWAAVRWICNGIGLSKGQMQRQVTNIGSDWVLSEGVAKLQLPTNSGDQETLCLKLDYVPLWLAKIPITPTMRRDTPELAETLKQYQTKAKDVLAAAFLGTSDPMQDKYFQAAEMISNTPTAHLPYVLEALKLGGIDLSAASQPSQKPTNAPADPWHIREFLADILPRATWDLLPYGLLRAMYISWMRRYYPGIAHIGGNRNKFIGGLRAHADLVCEHGWAFAGQVRTHGRMDGEEPLIAEFGCPDWYLLDCRSKDSASVKRVKHATRHRGLCRLAA